MTSRGDLLALVEAAPGPLRTIEGALTRWVDLRLVAAVHEHLARVSGLGGDGAVPKPAAEKAEEAGDPTQDGPAIDESLAYVLVALPDRWRVVGRGHIAVSDGHQSWVGTGSLVTERDSTRAAMHDAGPIGACLYPGPLLGWLDFGDPEPDEREGRFCWTVDAYPRTLVSVAGTAEPAVPVAAASRLPEEFLGVEHRFWFEARTGIVLRHEGFARGRAVLADRTDRPGDRRSHPAGRVLAPTRGDRAVEPRAAPRPPDRAGRRPQHRRPRRPGTGAPRPAAGRGLPAGGQLA